MSSKTQSFDWEQTKERIRLLQKTPRLKSYCFRYEQVGWYRPPQEPCLWEVTGKSGLCLGLHCTKHRATAIYTEHTQILLKQTHRGKNLFS